MTAMPEPRVSTVTRRRTPHGAAANMLTKNGRRPSTSAIASVPQEGCTSSPLLGGPSRSLRPRRRESVEFFESPCEQPVGRMISGDCPPVLLGASVVARLDAVAQRPLTGNRANPGQTVIAPCGRWALSSRGADVDRATTKLQDASSNPGRNDEYGHREADDEHVSHLGPTRLPTEAQPAVGPARCSQRHSPPADDRLRKIAHTPRTLSERVTARVWASVGSSTRDVE